MPRSTPWTGITDSKILTHQDLKQAADDGYLDQTQAITLDLTQAITKSRAIYHFDIDNDAISQRGVRDKDGNQLITKFHTRRPCNQCVSYDISVNQNDLNVSDDDKVYVYYYPCGTTGGTMSYTSYSYSGTFRSDVCIQNCATTDYYIDVLYDGGASLPNPESKFIQLTGQCTNSKSVVRTLTNCPTGTTSYSYTITKPGMTILNDVIELDNDYGNFDFTISANTNNDTEIFVGNYAEGFGELYVLTGGTNNITKTIGYYSSNGNSNKKLDVRVNSTTSGSTFTPFNLYFTGTCTSTISCQPTSEEPTETFVQNVVINALDGGVLIYFDKDGTQINRNINSGSNTLYECILLESLKNRPVIGTSPQQYSSPLVLSDPTTYTITSTGGTCTYISTGYTSNLNENVEITFEAPPASIGGSIESPYGINEGLYGYSTTVFWLDCNGNKQSRFIIENNTFTTCGKYGSGFGLPVIYGQSCECYEPQ